MKGIGTARVGGSETVNQSPQGLRGSAHREGVESVGSGDGGGWVGGDGGAGGDRGRVDCSGVGVGGEVGGEVGGGLWDPWVEGGAHGAHGSCVGDSEPGERGGERQGGGGGGWTVREAEGDVLRERDEDRRDAEVRYRCVCVCVCVCVVRVWCVCVVCLCVMFFFWHTSLSCLA
jgi:hypothetical protein